MDPRILLFILASLGLWGAVALKRPLRRLPVSLPMVYVGLGWGVFALPLGLPVLDPAGDELHAVAAEYLTEFIVIVSLMGTGLTIDRPFSWRGWRQLLPLLAVTMPLSVLAVAWIGWMGLGLAPAAALLLGAALSPTDPVLARSVQVGPPGKSERDDVRFNLTGEAGLNDGLAFPFTYLAIAAVGATGLGAWTLEWVLNDVLWRIGVGVGIGIGVGRAAGWFVFERSGEARETERPFRDETGQTNEGIVAMAAILGAYGLAEALHGYGFLAVFAGAVTLRQWENDSDYHARTHHFVVQLEEVVLVVMLFGFGGLLAGGGLSALTVPAALTGLAVVLVVRPLAGIVGLLGSALPWAGRWAVAFLGVRGIGTIYYLAFGQNHADFERLDVLWATASFAILVSILVHGMTARPIMRWLERHDKHVHPGTPDDVSHDV